MSANHRYSLQTARKASAPALLGVVALVAGMALGGCSSNKSPSTMSSSAINPVNWIKPYKVDIIQGNFVSKEQVELLKPGMPKAQVRDVLGTPLISSVFHADRWDYVFTMKRQGVESTMYKYTVFFKGDQLERFEGDTMPSEMEFIATLDNDRKMGKPAVLEATEEQLRSAEKKSSDAAAPASNALPPPLATAPTVYPPLESRKQ